MGKPSWISSQKSHIWIFNVGRGLCVFIRTALNQGIMYDFGSSEDFSPSDFLKENIIPYLDAYRNCKIAQTIISHPHADHISNIKCLIEPDARKSPFYSSLYTCPHDKIEGPEKPEAINWERIKNPENSSENVGIYKEAYEGRKPPLQTIFYDSLRSVPNLEYGFFYLRPPIVEKIFPENDQEYGNGISLVLFYRHGVHTILIPGDLNPDAFKHLLDEGEGAEKRFTKFDRRQCSLHPDWNQKSSDQPSLKSLLYSHGLSILVAPHHGLESGFSEDLYKSIKDEKPGLVVISEKKHLSEGDGTVKPFYQKSEGAKGQKVDINGKIEDRCSVSTRQGHILILFQGTGGLPEVFVSEDPEILLAKL